MRSLAAIPTIFVASAIAQTSIVSVYLPLGEPDAAFSASVVSVRDAHTTYAIKCKGCEDDDITYTAIDHPSTVEFAYSGSETALTGSCIFLEKNTASCTAEMTYSGTTTQTDVPSVTISPSEYSSVTVTAGASKLDADPSPSDDVTLPPPVTRVKPTTSDTTGSSQEEEPKPTATADDSEGAALPRWTQRPLLAAAAAIVGGAFLI